MSKRSLPKTSTDFKVVFRACFHVNVLNMLHWEKAGRSNLARSGVNLSYTFFFFLNHLLTTLHIICSQPAMMYFFFAFHPLCSSPKPGAQCGVLQLPHYDGIAAAVSWWPAEPYGQPGARTCCPVPSTSVLPGSSTKMQ